MSYQKKKVADILGAIDFGSSVAENDTLLQSARVDTSAFLDLYHDRVDLIPGTKGSGKSALYRIFVDFLPEPLFQERKVVIAHGVQQSGDQLFQIFDKSFDRMDEAKFVDFWCVYLISLANEQFIKNVKYAPLFEGCSDEIESFRRACVGAHIPDIQKSLSLRQVIDWVLTVLKTWTPKVKYRPPGDSGEFEFGLFGPQKVHSAEDSGEEADSSSLPTYVRDIKECLERVLRRIGYALWLMVDRLDELFPRRSATETRALRGLLRTLRIFESQELRVKVFLRDDIFQQIVSNGRGFVALTHVTSRGADTLRWSEDQILTMITKRLFAHEELGRYLDVDRSRLDASQDYRKEAFYRVFPPTVGRGPKNSPTLRWIYNHVKDGCGVVTPRDVIDLLTKAKVRQQDEFKSDPSGQTEYLIGPQAIRYGLRELSIKKRTTYLEAEFPHLWKHISKFVGKKTEYCEAAARSLFGENWHSIIDSLASVGVLTKGTSRDGGTSYKIPQLYRAGLQLTQGRAD